MHEEILTPEQSELLPLLKMFSEEFYLAGETAIALYLGHRRSIDFDLFTKKLHPMRIKNRIKKSGFNVDSIIFESSEELHLVVNSVKISFVEFPFDIPPPVLFKDIITLPSLLDLAAMKAYALGSRAKWKDYVDFYFLLKYKFTVEEIIKRAKEIFSGYFNSKLFLEQLAYFEDIDYSENVDFIKEAPSDEEIKEFLREVSLQDF